MCAHTRSWALYDIARHPAIQRRVARELAAAGLLAVPGAGAAARPLAFQDLAALPYLNAVLKESMRLHPAASTGTFREAPRDMMIGGYFVKKGSKVRDHTIMQQAV
jgi:cytochrome P450